MKSFSRWDATGFTLQTAPVKKRIDSLAQAPMKRQGVKEFKARHGEVDVLVLHGFHVEANLDSHLH